MRHLTLALVGLLLIGCSSSDRDVDATVKAGSGEITNPGGQPRDSGEAKLANAMRQQGDKVNQQRMHDAQAMRDAMEKSGGK